MALILLVLYTVLLGLLERTFHFTLGELVARLIGLLLGR